MASLAPFTAVRPRVILPETGDALPLDEVAAEWLAGDDPQCLEIVGGPGSGKTTALAWLAGTLRGFTGVDDMPDDFFLGSVLANSPLVCTSDRSHAHLSAVRSFQLAPWREDDWIEYLLATHPDRCGEVLARVRLIDRRERIAAQGSPRLWRLVLDEFAGDPQLTSVRAVAAVTFDRLRQPLAMWTRAESLLTAALLTVGAFDQLSDDLAVLRHPFVQSVYIARCVANDLRVRPSEVDAYLNRMLSPTTLQEVAVQVADDATCLRVIRELADSPARGCQAMAASILHAAKDDWRPNKIVFSDRLNLTGAELEGCQWPGVNLQGANLAKAEMNHANLEDANLEGIYAWRTNLRNARMTRASLWDSHFDQADLFGADLSLTTAASNGTSFTGCELSLANFESASLSFAQFLRAKLQETSFLMADLTGAYFHGAEINGADFGGAELRHAEFIDIDLRSAKLVGASFQQACLRGANLAEQQLPGANFQGADLSGADLSATVFTNADLENANLSGAGLADVEWEGADLRGADFNNASFHLGSTRCGLVGSPLACEGSRTGFYTDEFLEQDYQAPEDIRKANLCWADLRGARVANTDFYLVDLRHAKYSDDQREHFQRCGAILFRKKAK